MKEEPKRTPLNKIHHELGAKMVAFAGWEMPIHYPTGIMEEHRHCRNKAALFDVSHMAQIELTGDKCAEKLEALVPSSITSLVEGKARYTLFTTEAGGILDDLIVTNAGDHLYMVVNASRRDVDIPHLKNSLRGIDVNELTDRALIAIQGASAESVVASVCPVASQLLFMESITAEIQGVSCRVSRLGYTGEDGYEISIPHGDAEEITRVFLAHPDCQPAGLGARDTLRMEAGLCLYGNDIDTETTPIEASLLWVIPKHRRVDGGFLGATQIQNEIANGASRKLIGIRPIGGALARSSTVIESLEGDVIGKITSGGFGPSVNGPIAMGYVSLSHSKVGDALNLKVRGKQVPAEVTQLPFVAHNYKRNA